MKRLFAFLLALAMMAGLAGCAGTPEPAPAPTDPIPVHPTENEVIVPADAVDVLLSDGGVTCGSGAVYTANDIIYYEAGHDETYGEGTETDAHTAEEAAAHTVVHITAPGTYRLSGTLSAGQIFVDLGEDAKDDPNAVVTLLLDGVDITCTVAPAILFYRVYECGDKETFTLTPDLRGAGAVVALADGSENTVSGAYVAKIFEPGTEKKQHKYDGALYSRRSMRIDGSSGKLNIIASNEGLDSELHLEINGGEITITAQNDGINTNEDGISVTTVNGGTLNINAGLGDEGDGIDSNGALVINGGSLSVAANPETGDGGIDADLGIRLNGGHVVASGSRSEGIAADSVLQYMELNFSQTVPEGSLIALQQNGEEVFRFRLSRSCRTLTIASPLLQLGVAYTLTVNGVIQQHGGLGMAGGPGGSLIIPGIGEGDDPPPDVEIPPQPTVPLVPADADVPPVGDGEPQEPPMLPTPGGDHGGGMDFGGTFADISTEFILTKDNHTFNHVQDAASGQAGAR